jgi:recombination protein RecR
MEYPGYLARMIEQLRRLPGIGQKGAERLAIRILSWDESEVEEFAKAIVFAKRRLHPCPTCGMLTDKETCEICRNESRDQHTIMVVGSWQDVMAIENINDYSGVYHVLGGLISAQKGIMPDSLNIDSLIQRAADAQEVILALSPTMDGITTSAYIEKLLHSEYPDLKITQIARGIPYGGALDYADAMTLSRALDDRTIIGTKGEKHD